MLVNDTIAEEAIEMLRSKYDVIAEFHEKDKLLEIIPDYDAIIVRGKTKVPREVIEKGEKLKAIGRAGACTRWAAKGL